MSEYQQQLHQARSLLQSGDVQQAFKIFRPVLSYPGLVEQPVQLSEALQDFATISRQMIGAQFADLLQTAAQTLRDTKQLYQVGYEMIEYGLSDMAATILAYAYRLDPNNIEILHELAVALEKEMRYAEACHFLQQAPAPLQDHFLTRYLLAFNASMSGDLHTPRLLLPDLQRLQSQHAFFAELVERIERLLMRADALKGHTPLDTDDLRGWHLVLTGGLLLHLSPYGNEVMHGRYAFVQDSYGLCLQGIQRVQTVLETLQLSIPQIWYLPERNSQILAHATARALNLPLHLWPAGGSQEPGLVVAYDLSLLEDDTLDSISQHHPGQILWSHAICWTRKQPLSADLTTFLYQTNIAPWNEQLKVDQQTNRVSRSPVDGRDPTFIAADLLATEPQGSSPDDEQALLALTRAAALVGEDVLALLSTHGRRQKQWPGSPVPSSNFHD